MTDENLVRILDGNTFVVSRDTGDIDADPSMPTGFFSYDTRFLSKWQLRINGESLHPLSVDDVQYFETRFFLVPGSPSHYVDAKVSVIRQRMIGTSFDEQLTVFNHSDQPMELTIRMDAGNDFADLFEIKNVEQKAGRPYVNVEDGKLRLGYERQAFRRETVITSSEPAEIDENGFTFTVRIEPQQQWSTNFHVQAVVYGIPGGDPSVTAPGRAVGSARREMKAELDRWLEQAPRLETDNKALQTTYRRSLVDLAALRYTPMAHSGQAVPAAGLPWFMTIFGRDSIFTSLQVLPFVPELAAATLRLLGTLQGTKLDDFRDEEPGKILHELRYGETAAFEEQPHSPYYGTADATMLYVILLDEYERWTGDTQLVEELEPEARRALAWIDEYGDLMGNGYVWYQPRNESVGLVNQCWKDSWDSIAYRDGRFPPLPRATCELQGYAYDAKMRGARLAREFWHDPVLADRLEREAADLKERFNRDFWIEDGQYYALALDTDGNPVDSLTSNIGHLLWSGIVREDRAQAVVDHLLGPRLFSGWGVRTMAVGEGRYNPIGYHVGTVWPFDNSFIAWGLRRYGFRAEAGCIAEGLLDAAEYFGGRLPEAFAGYDRGVTKYPVRYPTACSPQAWSTGTPLLLLRTMLGLEPQGDHLVVDPALPVGMGRVGILDIPGRWGRVDAFARERVDIGRPPLHQMHGAPRPIV